ncbi:hypothetical protein NDU88_011221 [Pleurodeles waltl]|uniref:GB1/RHD3-type G domain-containing protein n=2 Tax=Pleurodeles waltl TaxID=8319 RepID=A0AAV7Q4E8_PLEWA|nr:hypothetical protein NDU88_011221 [Pleurodeles waltl]
MEAPVCLVRNTDSAEFEIMQDAIEILNHIDQPVVVVAIVGYYRTGKSYLMNRLAGKNKGFSLGATIQSHTKGIWMWCRPHPTKPGHTLVLLDTEGLGDAEKGDSDNDCALFTLAVLLSSVFVYNSMGTINQQALEQLHFVTELSDRIKVKAEGTEKKEGEEEEEDDPSEKQFVRFFPAFVWVVRDFILELNIDGKDVTESEYLERMLKLKEGASKKVMEYNLLRECLRSFFPTRDCFVFVRPVSGKEISKMDSLPEDALDPKFIEQTHNFCTYVFEKAEVKKVKGGHELNGRTFSFLVQNYVTAIVNGGAPCIENAVLSMAKSENEAAMQDAERHYKAQMEKLVQFPAEVQELSDLHGKCEKEAINVFMKRSFKDKDGYYQGMLKVKVEENYVAMVKKNENVSLEKCRSLLKDLSTKLQHNMTSGVYCQPGMHKAYIDDRKKVVEQFQEIPNKGVKAQFALEEFLESKKVEAETILQADTNLTLAEKRVAEEKERAALIAQEKKAAEERASQTEQMLKDQERSHNENMEKLEAKMKQEAAQQRMESQKALESMLNNQAALIREGFEQKAMLLQREIERLRKERTKPPRGFFRRAFRAIF